MILKKYSKHLMVMFISMLIVNNLGMSKVAFANETEAEKITVVTSFYPMYEFVKQVGGYRINVSQLVPDNASPHGYEPSANNIVAVKNAAVFVYSSDTMEHWVESLLNNVDKEELAIVQASGNGTEQPRNHSEQNLTEAEEEGYEAMGVEIIGLSDHYHTGDVITLQANSTEAVTEWRWQVNYPGEDWQIVENQTTELFEYEASNSSFSVQALGMNNDGEVLIESEILNVHIDNHDELDPHSWLDPVLAIDQVNRIQEALIQADPEGESEYRANAEAFNQKLQTLHEDYEQAFADAKNRSFVVQHEAFGYLADRYQLEQISVGGLSTEVEPSPARIGEIAKIIDEIDASIIYYQQGGNTSIAQTIALETGVEIVQLYDLEVAPQDQDLGYIEAMQENLKALKLSIQ